MGHLLLRRDRIKKSKSKALAELYIIVDERANEYELTDKGIQRWGELKDGIGSRRFRHARPRPRIRPDRSQLQRSTKQEKMQKKVASAKKIPRRKERPTIYARCSALIFSWKKMSITSSQEDKIVIIDENTGRPQPGRRFSDGLHQAIEAKEGVEIQGETQTYATITLQNYFRMYEKLAGMTGTAMTEAQ